MDLSGLGRAVVAHVSGDLTAGGRRELARLVEDALARGAREVVVDLGAAGYVDTAALGLLVTLARRARARGGQVAVANVDEALRTLFGLTHLDTVLAVTTLAGGRAD